MSGGNDRPSAFVHKFRGRGDALQKIGQSK